MVRWWWLVVSDVMVVIILRIEKEICPDMKKPKKKGDLSEKKEICPSIDICPDMHLLPPIPVMQNTQKKQLWSPK